MRKGVVFYFIAEFKDKKTQYIEQVMEGKSLEDEENPYFSPANRENELYVQLRNQGIKMIRSRDIE